MRKPLARKPLENRTGLMPVGLDAIVIRFPIVVCCSICSRTIDASSLLKGSIVLKKLATLEIHNFPSLVRWDVLQDRMEALFLEEFGIVETLINDESTSD